jgi:addiction module HigA family antidote
MSTPVNRMRPIHPGEILREEYLGPMGMSANALAQAIDVPANRVSDIIRERRSLTADTASRLARAFGTSVEFWLHMQQSYDLRVFETSQEAKKLDAIRPIDFASRLAQRTRTKSGTQAAAATHARKPRLRRASA